MVNGGRILVTGAGGFVGSALCRALGTRGFRVRGATRRAGLAAPPGGEVVQVAPLGPDTDWLPALEGVDAVVHLAARVHLLRDAAPSREYHAANALGTLQLARQAARSGVRRFVFVSSVKVHGEESSRPYRECDPPAPSDPYGDSKWQAEQLLAQLKEEVEVVVLRPPLVYGPGVRANFLSLLRGVQRGVPLPLAALQNQRSMIFLGNLVDAVELCLVHPAAAGQTYLVSDGSAPSTTDVVRATAAALGRPVRLFSVPPSLLRLLGRATGKSAQVERVVGSLVVDCSKIQRELGWRPPFTMEEGLRITAAWFREAGERDAAAGEGG